MWFWELVGEITAPVILALAALAVVLIVSAPFIAVERLRVKRRAADAGHEIGGPDLRVDPGAMRKRSTVVADLQAMAVHDLGNRARKVNDVLDAADSSREGVEAAIDQISSLQILFVDAERLKRLAERMRTRVTSDSSSEIV
jgi:hypothetical protein